MIVWKLQTLVPSQEKYWSAGDGLAFTGIEPFIGFLEELPTFVQNAIAILHIAGEGKNIEGIGMWSADRYDIVVVDKYDLIVPKEIP